MTSVDFPSIIFLAVVGMIVYFGVTQKSSEDYAKERRLEDGAKRKADEEAELALLNSGFEMADVNNRIKHLLSRYTWAQLLEPINIDDREIELLQNISRGERLLELPNPRTRHPSELEEYGFKVARQLPKEDLFTHGQSIDLSDYYQGITTITLEHLAFAKLVNICPKVDDETREYDAEPTDLGRRLLALLVEHGAEKFKYEAPRVLLRSQTARKLLRRHAEEMFCERNSPIQNVQA